MMKEEEIKALLDRYLAGQCNEQERAFVETWYNSENKQITLSKKEIEEDLRIIAAQLPVPYQKNRLSWLPYAAAVLLIVFAGIYFYPQMIRQKVAPGQAAKSDKSDLLPGSSKAILTLGDGRKIALDDINSGEIAQEANHSIYKNRSGQLVYRTNSQQAGNVHDIPFNTITTPRGGQYQVMLPDGSKVWINAASSLTYAAVDTEKERIVKLNGEGYFEVAKIADRPFKVITKNQIVEVLGTHFNINSYADEPLERTALIEGSIKVVERKNNQSVILKPGQQASLDHHHRLSIMPINITQAVAWKDGLFYFENSDIETIMRQFARWYDVEVEFEGKKPNIKLWGEAYRNVNASKALNILTYFNLKYRIETNNGTRKIIIYT